MEPEAGPQHPAEEHTSASQAGQNICTGSISTPQPPRAECSESRKRYVVEPPAATESCVPSVEAWHVVHQQEAQVCGQEAKTVRSINGSGRCAAALTPERVRADLEAIGGGAGVARLCDM